MLRAIILICSFYMCSIHAKESLDVIDTQKWHLSAAFGVGALSNPLNGGDPIPLLVVPDIAYYDEQFYFDNGQLGYTFVERNNHIVSLISEINPENRFFVRWHPATVLVNTGFVASQQKHEVNIEYLDKPNWALDAGINYHFIKHNWQIEVSLLHDISGVYHGHRGKVSASYMQQLGSFRTHSTLGVAINSARLNNYYYGIAPSDNLGFVTQLSSSQNVFAKMIFDYPISATKSWVTHIGYHDYSQLNDSPLFRSRSAWSFFTGLKYVF